MTGVPNSVRAVDTMAAHFRKINQRLASLERASTSGGGGVPSDWTPYDTRFVNVPGDAMSGPLTIGPVSPAANELLALKAPAGAYAYMAWYQSVTRRGWVGAHPTLGDVWLVADVSDLILRSSVGVVRLQGGAAADALTIQSTKVASMVPFQSQVPADFWSANSAQIFFGTIGHVGTDGSNRIGIYSNTYRNIGNTSSNGGGFAGSAAVECDPTGYVLFRADTGIPAGNGATSLGKWAPNVLESFTPIYVDGQFRVFLSGLTALLAGSNGTSYLAFYTAATSYSTLGARSGYVGYSSAGNLLLNNEMSGGHIYIDAGASTGNIMFRFGGGEQYRMSPQAALVGKNTYNTYQTASGIEMWSADGQLMLTQTTNTFNSVVHIGAADAAAVSFWRFYRTGSVLIGQIRQVATTGVEYLGTSDKRLKTFVRDVDDDESLRILRELAPVHYTWNHVPDDDEHIGFFAQDLYLVAPEAVGVGSGEPGDDDFEPWGTDLAKLVPRLTAILQAIDRRLTALEAA
jgi:hypothetical protein